MIAFFTSSIYEKKKIIIDVCVFVFFGQFNETYLMAPNVKPFSLLNTYDCLISIHQHHRTVAIFAVHLLNWLHKPF